MLYKMNMEEMDSAVSLMNKVVSDCDDTHSKAVEVVRTFRYDGVINNNARLQQFFDETVEHLREFTKCKNELEELREVLNVCIRETRETDKRVESYMGNIPEEDIEEAGNTILPQYTANLPEGTGTSGIETSWGYQQVGVNSGTVAEFNTEALDVSCTFTTLYQLHKKGLGFPFNGKYGTDGTNWFNLYAGNSEDKYAGASGLRNLIDEYKASEQTADLENIVVSFSGGWENHGHVLLIDHVSKDGIITFKDQSGPDGSPLIADYFSTTSAMEAINNDVKCPWQSLSIDDFEKKYKDVGLTMNGAILIGTPQ
ncbi:MAG: hypothetical protein IKL70_01950 [Oscillospiraceae bacterium]|nr:hypothetical protein [Oscillospiraceae bacterium]